MLPVISKLYCRGGETEFVVRMRPHAVYGGGLVVTDCSSHKVVFRVDGCGVLGKRDELILRDADSVPLLLMRRKGAGFVEALCFNKVWKGYRLDQLEPSGSVVKKQLVFSLKESSSSSCFISKGGGPIRITTQPRIFSNKSWDFEIKGYFPDKCCSILDCQGNVVGITKELETFKDVYHVVVNPGMDQAFVFGVIAILDYIHGESTICPS